MTPPPNNHHRFGKLLHFEHGGGIENVVLVELNIFGPRRSRAGGDENESGPWGTLFTAPSGQVTLYRVGYRRCGRRLVMRCDVVPGGVEGCWAGVFLFAALYEVLRCMKLVQRDVGLELLRPSLRRAGGCESRRGTVADSRRVLLARVPQLIQAPPKLAIGFDDEWSCDRNRPPARLPFSPAGPPPMTMSSIVIVSHETLQRQTCPTKYCPRSLPLLGALSWRV